MAAASGPESNSASAADSDWPRTHSGGYASILWVTHATGTGAQTLRPPEAWTGLYHRDSHASETPPSHHPC